MTTFTDLTMLLLTFFVLLVATSKQATVKLSKMLEELSDAEQVDAKVTENTIPDISHGKNDEKAVSKKHMDELYKKLKVYVDNNSVSQVNVYREDTGVSIVIVDNLIFDKGDANAKLEAKEVISQLVGLFQSVPNPIVVEGHTDSRPIHNEKSPSNWELSSARAANMIHHLIEVYNVDDKRLASVGYVDTKPVAPNDSPQNWEKNRRVVIY
ncbi:OmpA family protein [Bacillus mycoides]|uniref:OmpA family protein n=1 Tax=Bacillus mycoides TaxID=1405 RepID=UPI003F751CA6